MQATNIQYSSVSCYGNFIYYRGYNKSNRERIQKKIEYMPTLFIPTNEKTGYVLVTNKKQNMLPIAFDSIKDAKDAIYQNRSIENAPSYAGMRNFEYAYIIDTKDGHDPDLSLIRVANIDIEVISDDEEETEFPNPVNAKQPIVAITVKTRSKFYTFGLDNFKNPDPENVNYYKCENEIDLLAKFLTFWKKYDPDVITGWNIRGFDIPYLVNRIRNVLGEDFVRKLSPWGMVHKNTIKDGYGGEIETYNLIGIETLEYIQMYKKVPHKNQNQESYRLEHISQIELGEGKLEYEEEYGTLANLYRKNPQKFLEYNIKDVSNVDRIDKKLDFIRLYCTTAYDASSNFSDVAMQSVMVDNIVFRYAKEKKAVIPAKKRQDGEKEQFTGAYVKPTLAGKYRHIVTCDLTSLYPHLQMQFNISPDTLVEKLFVRKPNVDSCVKNGMEPDLYNIAVKNNCAVAGNGQFFTNEFVGLLPEIQTQMFKDRKAYKKKMLAAEEKLVNLTKGTPEYAAMEIEVGKYNNLQIAKKVQLNSIYGVSGNQGFRYFDIRISEAITLSGQIVIKRITAKLNEFLSEKVGKEQDFIIGSDTDSTMINFGPIVDQHLTRKEQDDVQKTADWIDAFCKKELEPFIDETFKQLATEMNCVENKMHMKREKIAVSGIYTKKKKYALLIIDEEGVRNKEPKIKVVGLESVKSSTPKICREKFKEALMICLTKEEKDIQEYIRKFKQDVVVDKKYDPEMFAISKSVGGMIKYHIEPGQSFKPKTPSHVKGALFYNHLIHNLKLHGKVKEIQNGEKVRELTLIEPNKYGKNVFAYVGSNIPKAFKFDKNLIDIRYQFDKTFIKPISIVVETCGWSVEKQRSLI